MRSITCFFLSIFSSFYVAQSDASEVALAMSAVVGNACTVMIWEHHPKPKSDLHLYNGSLNGDFCHIGIPVKVFKKDFDYCFLSGITVEPGGRYFAQFGGGIPGDRDEYWFEWTTNANPNWLCVIN